MADIRKTVGARVKEMRLARGMTQEELGELASLSYKFIGEVERGIGNPTVTTLASVAEALGVEVIELVSGGHGPATIASLSLKDYVAVREAKDSLEAVLDRLRTDRPSKRR